MKTFALFFAFIVGVWLLLTGKKNQEGDEAFQPVEQEPNLSEEQMWAQEVSSGNCDSYWNPPGADP